MRTFNDITINPGWDFDFTKTHPWRHPGTAPVYRWEGSLSAGLSVVYLLHCTVLHCTVLYCAVSSPCGVYGGNPDGCPVGEGEPGDDCPGGGSAYGPSAEEFPFEVTLDT